MVLVDKAELRKLRSHLAELLLKNAELENTIKKLEIPQLNVKLGYEGEVLLVGHGGSSTECSTCP